MSGFRGGRRFDDSGRLLHFSELPDTFAWQELKDLCKAYGRVIRADVNRCVWARSQIAAASPRYSPLLRYIVNPTARSKIVFVSIPSAGAHAHLCTSSCGVLVGRSI